MTSETPKGLSVALAEMKAERDLLQDILDNRPAINAGLPETYIRWSQAIYSGDVFAAARQQSPALPDYPERTSPQGRQGGLHDPAHGLGSADALALGVGVEAGPLGNGEAEGNALGHSHDESLAGRPPNPQGERR